MTLDAPVEFFYHELIASVLEDIRRQEGKKISWRELPGYNYDKKWGATRAAHMHITQAVPSQCYGYTMNTANQEFVCEYRLERKDDHSMVLKYTEQSKGKNAKVKANSNVTEFMLGWLRKHRFKKMAKQMAQKYYN